jgi:hypothetical protein
LNRKSEASREKYLKIFSGGKGATSLEGEVAGISAVSGVHQAEIFRVLSNLTLGGGGFPITVEQRTRPRMRRLNDDDTED